MVSKYIPTGLETLPEELKTQILDYLNVPAPSWNWQQKTLDTHLISSDTQPLKSLSLVSKAWNRLTTPIIFRFLRLRVQLQSSEDQVRALDTSSVLEPVIKTTRTSFHKWLFHDAGFPRDIRLPYRHCWQDAPTKKAVEWSKALENQLAGLLALLESSRLGHDNIVDSIAIVTADELNNTGLDYIRDEVHCLISTAAFWSYIFERLNPRRVTVLAPPSTIACLLGCSINVQDAWAFPGMSLQLVSVWQEHNNPSKSTFTPIQHYNAMSPIELNMGPNENGRPALASLLYVRPWTHLAVNEGSFLAAYSTYEYFHYQPPGILAPISRAFRLDMNIFSVAYKAVFPFFTHTADPLDVLTSTDSVKHLYVEVAPSSDDNVLGDPTQVGKVDLMDCWREVDLLYSLIVNPDPDVNGPILFDGLIQRLEVFQSGDSSISSVKQALGDPLARVGYEEEDEGTWRYTGPTMIDEDDDDNAGPSGSWYEY